MNFAKNPPTLNFNQKINVSVKFATCHLPTAAAITESVTIKSCKGHEYISKVRFLSQHLENHFVHITSNISNLLLSTNLYGSLWFELCDQVALKPPDQT